MAFASRNAVLSVHEQRQTVLMHEIEERFVIFRHRSVLSAEQRTSLVSGTRDCVYRLEEHVKEVLVLLDRRSGSQADASVVRRQLDMQAYAAAAHLRVNLAADQYGVTSND